MTVESDPSTDEFEARIAAAMHTLAHAHVPEPPVRNSRPVVRRGVLLSVAAAVLVLIGVGGVVAVTQRHGGREPSTTVPVNGGIAPVATSPGPGNESPATTQTATTPASVSSEPAASVPVPPAGLQTVPFGATSTAGYFQVREVNVDSRPFTDVDGAIVLSYELQLGFDPAGRSSTIEQLSPTTTDGALAVEVTCNVDDCLSSEPVNDFVQTAFQLTLRRTGRELTAGPHSIEFELRFDDGTVEAFAVQVMANPEPSEYFAELVAASTGAPHPVQTVFGRGAFAYHAITAFGSIWILDNARGFVTRIDATTGAVLATMDTQAGGNRLAATNDAVYVSAEPAVRIDPQTNQATTMTGGAIAYGIISDGTTVWTASYQGPVQRIDPDGTITTLDLPSARWMDLAFTNGLVWALSSARNDSRLIAFDGATGEIRYDIAIPSEGDGFPVRLVADGTNVVVGTDTSGGGGRTGKLLIVDPTTGAIVDTVELDSRPEGIALTPNHIWTSSAVLDRQSLEVLDEQLFGFTITRGPDGSIWGTTAVPGAQSGTFVATRTAPGDLAG